MTPEQSLWVAVLERAFLDATEIVKRPEPTQPSLKKVYNKTKGLEFNCKSKRVFLIRYKKFCNFQELTSVRKKQRRDKYRGGLTRKRVAVNYITKPSKELLTVCTYAGIDINFFNKKMKEALNGKSN